MVDVTRMCDKHLLGEHVECHMLAGTILRRRSIDGFIAKGLLEPASLARRHEALAEEMGARGFRHASPLEVPDMDYLGERVCGARVDSAKSERDLAERCDTCRDSFSAGGRV